MLVDDVCCVLVVVVVSCFGDGVCRALFVAVSCLAGGVCGVRCLLFVVFCALFVVCCLLRGVFVVVAVAVCCHVLLVVRYLLRVVCNSLCVA